VGVDGTGGVLENAGRTSWGGGLRSKTTGWIIGSVTVGGGLRCGVGDKRDRDGALKIGTFDSTSIGF
jgi:hypothetical protein